MSAYQRDGHFANAAVVAAVQPQLLLGQDIDALGVLAWVEKLEYSWYDASAGYRAPASTIRDFLASRAGHSALGASSYPLGLHAADLATMLPVSLITAIQAGIKDFCQVLKGYDQGQLIGLESKTSAPIQVLRDPQAYWARFPNLYLAGEASGWSGGIVSSAADGLKAAIAINQR
jgi:uncharacterized FAD-dependent dehydrogenase